MSTAADCPAAFVASGGLAQEFCFFGAFGRSWQGMMRHTGCIARTLSDGAWQSTDGEGQYTVRLSRTNDAAARAHRQLAACGGAVLVTSTEDPAALPAS